MKKNINKPKTPLYICGPTIGCKRQKDVLYPYKTESLNERNLIIKIKWKKKKKKEKGASMKPTLEYASENGL